MGVWKLFGVGCAGGEFGELTALGYFYYFEKLGKIGLFILILLRFDEVFSSSHSPRSQCFRPKDRQVGKPARTRA